MTFIAKPIYHVSPKCESTSIVCMYNMTRFSYYKSDNKRHKFYYKYIILYYVCNFIQFLLHYFDHKTCGSLNISVSIFQQKHFCTYFSAGIYYFCVHFSAGFLCIFFSRHISVYLHIFSRNISVYIFQQTFNAYVTL